MNTDATASRMPDADVVELLAASLERLAARVSRDLDADVAEGVPPEDPAWAETISGVATYARECLAILDDPRVVAALVAPQGVTR
jgi:hypothetical protein